MRPLVSTVFALLLLTPLAASAEDRVKVAWTAPRECPSSAELTSRAASRITTDASVRANGRVTRSGAKYKLVLEIETAHDNGERAIEAETCEALATSAAVVIAMSVAPKRDEPGPETPARPAPPPPANEPAPKEPPKEASPPTAEAPMKPPSDRGLATLRAEMVVDAGMLPSLGLGGGASAGLNLGRGLHVEANGAFFGSQDAHASSDASRGASLSLASFGARTCWALTRGVEIAPCAGVAATRLSASGFGAERVSSDAAVTWGPEGGATALVPIAGAVSLRAGASLFVPISRQSFVIVTRGPVHQPAAVAIRGFVGPEVRF